MNTVGTLWIFGLMFLICADVVGRYVFSAPIKGAAEMVGYSIVTAVFLQMASTLHAGRFTRVELLIEPLMTPRRGGGLLLQHRFTWSGPRFRRHRLGHLAEARLCVDPEREITDSPACSHSGSGRASPSSSSERG